MRASIDNITRVKILEQGKGQAKANASIVIREERHYSQRLTQCWRERWLVGQKEGLKEQEVFLLKPEKLLYCKVCKWSND